MEEIEKLTGVEGVKVEVEEVEEAEEMNCGREQKDFSRFRMLDLNSPCFAEESSPDSFEEYSGTSSPDNSA